MQRQVATPCFAPRAATVTRIVNHKGKKQQSLFDSQLLAPLSLAEKPVPAFLAEVEKEKNF